MKIKNYKLKATIPTCSYGNLQPEIEVDSTDIDKASEFALDHIKELHSRFSDAPLKETTQQVSEVVKLESFNEDLTIEFDKNKHTYEDYISGSVYASKFYKKFDGKSIAKNCEKSWGVPAQDIQDLWSSNAKVATDFGTIIHRTLEHYFNYESIASKISKARDDDENKAMPKHPILKSIIEGFTIIDKFEGEIMTEVFVTDKKNKRCGQIDRLLILDKEKKVCRVQDYKVNIGAEEESSNMKAMKPYDELPPNKLTKCQIQLSFYADILEQTGWTVEGLDAFYLEDEWKHYSLDKLDII